MSASPNRFTRKELLRSLYSLCFDVLKWFEGTKAFVPGILVLSPPDQQQQQQQQLSTPVQGFNRSATSTPKHHPQDPAIATKQPLFVAPLKDIAVVSGQPARFECIVACDATPAVRWTKNNVPIDESGQRYYPEYRNGLCRLSLPVAYEGDAGKYCCLAENHLGHSQTCADLTVVDSDWRTASAVTEF